jgi:two-component system alkaline phosphatase synthesis response regulator PhoP
LERNGTYAIAVQFLNSKYNPATAVGTDRFGSATQFAPSASRASPQVIVLTVDSDVATSDLAHQTLSKDGYTVVSVSSARQALDFLRTAVPAVVIADIGGNDIPGQDLCVIIKRDERLQRVPVILLTRSDESADQAASQQLGAMACIAKPFNPGRLSQVVRLVAPPPGKRSVYGASRYFSSSIERAL